MNGYAGRHDCWQCGERLRTQDNTKDSAKQWRYGRKEGKMGNYLQPPLIFGCQKIAAKSSSTLSKNCVSKMQNLEIETPIVRNTHNLFCEKFATFCWNSVRDSPYLSENCIFCSAYFFQSTLELERGNLLPPQF